ncbi:MAG: tRNA (uridine(34)/cytosine(34)/5-carboxymethylaminomethyluridine(34)-2'-O)-methyltransferase TrmL [Usitatibacter sp.]
MFDVVLVHPEIPPNTGNVIRLCANTGARLHLVEPLGFSLDDKQLKRAGLDYHEFATIRVHSSWDACVAALDAPRLFAFTKHAKRRYDEVEFHADDAFVFGAETAGLPAEVLARFPGERRLRLPMRPDNRSLNLSNAVAVVVFEAWRQNRFAGSADPGP